MFKQISLRAGHEIMAFRRGGSSRILLELAHVRAEHALMARRALESMGRYRLS